MLQLQEAAAMAVCADCAHGHHERSRVELCCCPCHGEPPSIERLMKVSAVRAVLDLSAVKVFDPRLVSDLPTLHLEKLFASCRTWVRRRWGCL